MTAQPKSDVTKWSFRLCSFRHQSSIGFGGMSRKGRGGGATLLFFMLPIAYLYITGGVCFRYRYNDGNGKLVCAGGGEARSPKRKESGETCQWRGPWRTDTNNPRSSTKVMVWTPILRSNALPGFSNASRGNHKENQGTPGDEGG